MEYPVRLTKDDNGTLLVTFPDFPEAVTFGDTREEALARAAEALATAIDLYIKDRRALPPPPSSTSSGTRVLVPPILAAKVELYQAMRHQRIGKTELARRLDWHLPQVDRLLDARHASRLDQLEAGLGAVGKRLTLVVEDVVQPRSRARRAPGGGRTRRAKPRARARPGALGRR